MSSNDFSHYEPKYKLFGKSLHVKLAAYYALVAAVVLSLICFVIFLVYTEYTFWDWISLVIFLIIVVTSLLALYANYKESSALYSPFIVTIWVVKVLLILFIIFTILMAIFNPVFWQNWMSWLFGFSPDLKNREKRSASRGLAIMFPIVSFILLCLFGIINAIVMRARIYARDKTEWVRSGGRRNVGPGSVPMSFGQPTQIPTQSREHALEVGS